jgi:Outer membrane receptor for ferrienterochelin and colicins
MRNIYKTAAIISLFINLIMAQTVDIRGTVKDAASGSPLAGANVIVVGTSIGTATDADGKYEIPNLNPGDYILKAAYIGYLEQIDSLSIASEKDIEKDFNLSYTTIEGQEVVVTGQAKGQMDAINRQLNAKSIMNIVSSDRIRELPDANVAETIARVPGVTIKRDGGEGNKVIIRGLSPKYNSITVDGTRLSSTDYGDRSTDLSMISTKYA